MAIKIPDLDVANVTQHISGFDKYQRALVLFRHRRRTIARVVLLLTKAVFPQQSGPVVLVWIKYGFRKK
jgi:hypothetical protein